MGGTRRARCRRGEFWLGEIRLNKISVNHQMKNRSREKKKRPSKKKKYQGRRILQKGTSSLFGAYDKRKQASPVAKNSLEKSRAGQRDLRRGKKHSVTGEGVRKKNKKSSSRVKITTGESKKNMTLNYMRSGGIRRRKRRTDCFGKREPPGSAHRLRKRFHRGGGSARGKIGGGTHAHSSLQKRSKPAWKSSALKKKKKSEGVVSAQRKMDCRKERGGGQEHHSSD